MSNWKRFDEASLPDKKAFYSHLNLGNITDEDYIHAQKIFNKFKLRFLGECHDLYVQNNALLFVDVIENFKINVLEYMNLILLFFLSPPGLAY